MQSLGRVATLAAALPALALLTILPAQAAGPTPITLTIAGRAPASIATTQTIDLGSANPPASAVVQLANGPGSDCGLTAQRSGQAPVLDSFGGSEGWDPVSATWTQPTPLTFSLTPPAKLTLSVNCGTAGSYVVTLTTELPPPSPSPTPKGGAQSPLEPVRISPAASSAARFPPSTPAGPKPSASAASQPQPVPSILLSATPTAGSPSGPSSGSLGGVSSSPTNSPSPTAPSPAPRSAIRPRRRLASHTSPWPWLFLATVLIAAVVFYRRSRGLR